MAEKTYAPGDLVVRQSPLRGAMVWELSMNANGIKQATVHTATFMLTGIERSARLQDSASDTLGAVVSRHEELLDEVISRHGGQRRLYQDDNNGAVAAFTRALDAVVAALDVQRALHRKSWLDHAASGFGFCQWLSWARGRTRRWRAS